MSVKVRLSRHGRKARAFYHIVVADSRSPRDGRFIEKLGTYNPMTNPATIELNFDSALAWLQKGAFNEAEAERRFNAWMDEKNIKVSNKKSELAAAKRADEKARLEAETKVKEQRAEAIAKKRAEAMAALEAEAKAAAAEAEGADETAEAPAETPAE